MPVSPILSASVIIVLDLSIVVENNLSYFMYVCGHVCFIIMSPKVIYIGLSPCLVGEMLGRYPVLIQNEYRLSLVYMY